jgi:hypothetical protein
LFGIAWSYRQLGQYAESYIMREVAGVAVAAFSTLKKILARSVALLSRLFDDGSGYWRRHMRWECWRAIRVRIRV